MKNKNSDVSARWRLLDQYSASLAVIALIFATAVASIHGRVNLFSTTAASSDYLDITFGNGGIVIEPITDQSSLYDEPNAIQVQADGKIVVCGMVHYSDDETGYPISTFIARYNPTGSLDHSFGTNGKVIAPVGSSAGGTYAGQGMALQPDGKIITVGHAFGGGSSFAVRRYNPEGTPDNSFGNGGLVLTSGTSGAYDVAVQPDGKIVVSGHANVGGEDNNFAVVRYNPNGSLDTGFGAGGRAITPVGIGNVVDQSYAMALQPDGKIVVVGTSLIIGRSYDMALVRYNQNGSIDTGFGTGGKIIIPAAGDSVGRDVVVQPDGKIVVVGSGFGAGSTEIIRFKADGSIDTEFAANGSFTMDSSYFHGCGVALQSDGKIVAFGEGMVTAGSGYDFAALRLAPNGSPDRAFGTNGRVLTSISTKGSGAATGTLQSDGKLLAFGIVRTGDQWSNDVVITRYLSDPAVSISGRVMTPAGQGLRNAVVTLTDSSGNRRSELTSTLGFYSFGDIPAGHTVTIAVTSRRYRFQPVTRTINENLLDVDLVGIE